MLLNKAIIETYRKNHPFESRKPLCPKFLLAALLILHPGMTKLLSRYQNGDEYCSNRADCLNPGRDCCREECVFVSHSPGYEVVPIPTNSRR